MKLCLARFGQVLVTHFDALSVAQAVGDSKVEEIDCGGVYVANHPFFDELGLRLQENSNLNEIRISNANPYVLNCIKAGFATVLRG